MKIQQHKSELLKLLEEIEYKEVGDAVAMPFCKGEILMNGRVPEVKGFFKITIFPLLTPTLMDIFFDEVKLGWLLLFVLTIQFQLISLISLVN